MRLWRTGEMIPIFVFAFLLREHHSALPGTALGAGKTADEFTNLLPGLGIYGRVYAHAHCEGPAGPGWEARTWP